MLKKVLVLCHDTVGAKMAGPGIRYQNIAEQISKVAKVTLAVYGSKTGTSGGILTVKATDEGYKSAFNEHDIIFAQWMSLEMLSYAKSAGKVVIIDLYAPVPIEYLASQSFAGKKMDEQADLEFAGIIATYQRYLTQADYFVCSNERQRDFWVGFLTASGGLTPTGFLANSKLDNLALCPMGISSSPPKVRSLKLRKAAGLDKKDFVLLWTGGIWDWFDAQTVIKAISLLGDSRVKLVFMGTKHPNDEVYKDEMSETKAARNLAKELGLTGKSVFFLDGWVDYSDRASYLLDADAAIYADKDTIEARFSHRTRVLDHIWAGLPTICSKGDYLAQMIEELDIGIVVDRTPESFASAVKKIVSDSKLLAKKRSNINKIRPQFTWEEQTKDLLSFIKQVEPGVKTTVQPVSLPPTTSQKMLRRAKKSILVLLGRIDV